MGQQRRRIPSPLWAAFLCASLALLLAVDSAHAGNEGEKALVAQFVSRSERVLEERELPALYKNAAKIFERISRAQQDTVGNRGVVVNRIYILDSGEPTIALRTIARVGIAEQRNVLFISTGLLQFLYETGKETPTNEALLRGSRRLAGLFAEQLAAPMDALAEDSLEKRDASKQAQQLRADFAVLTLLKRAGYPPNSLYEALIFMRGSSQRQDSWAGFRHTLEWGTRLTSQRMRLMIDRYQTGSYTPKYPEPEPPGVLRELDQNRRTHLAERKTYPRPPPLVPPTTIVEAVDRMETCLDDYRYGGDVYRNFERLRLWLDELLIARGDDVTDEEHLRVTGLFEMAGNTSGFTVTPPNAEKFAKEFPDKDPTLLHFAGKTHWDLVNDVPYYRSPRFVEWAKRRYETVIVPQTSETYHHTGDRLWPLEHLLPSEVIGSEFRAFIADSLLRDCTSERERTGASFPGLFRYRTPRMQIILAQILVEDVFPKLTPAQMRNLWRLDFYIERPTYLLPLFRALADGGATDPGAPGSTPKELRAHLDDPKNQADRNRLAKVAAAIWAKRGEYGALDYVLPDFHGTDWQLIFELLGKSPAEGHAQLVAAVKEFTKTDEYGEVIRLGHALYSSGKLQASPPSWVSEELHPYLAGAHLTGEKAPKLAEIGQALGSNHLLAHPELFRRLYRQALSKALQTVPDAELTLEKLDNLEMEVLQQVFGRKLKRRSRNSHDGPEPIPFPHFVDDVRAEVIAAASSLTLPKRRELLAGLFASRECWETYLRDQKHEVKPWILNAAYNDRLMATLVASKTVASPEAYFLGLRAKRDSSYGTNSTSHFRAVEAFRKSIDAQLDTIGTLANDATKFARLKTMADAYIDPSPGRYEDKDAGNSKVLRELKDRFVALAIPLNISGAERMDFFAKLTSTGGTPSTDQYLSETLAGGVLKTISDRTAKFLERALSERRVNSQVLELELATRLLIPELESLRRHPVTDERLSDYLSRVHFLAPRSSQKKDDLIESMAWALYLNDPRQLALIESHKSYNWRKASPTLVNWTSFFGENVSRMDGAGVEATLEYLREPKGKEIPPAFETALRESAAGQVVELVQSRKITAQFARKTEEDLLYASKRQFETMALDATQEERVPIFDLLLNGGKEPIVERPEFALDLARRYLGYEPDSDKEKMLMAFLEVIPQEEVTPSLAYLLSVAGKNKSGIRSVFEVFQSVGIKGAQFASIWKLFDDPTNFELADLKDNAKPMTLDEIWATLRADLTPKEFARIKHIKLRLGSASLKTVALVELHDGSEVVVALQRPHAEEQIRSNLLLARRYIAKLAEKGMELHASFLTHMINAIERQLEREVDFTLEGAELEYAQSLFEELNHSMKDELDGWKFSVPQLIPGFKVRRNILFMTKAAGEAFEKADLTPEERVHTGRLLAKAPARLFFRRGWFDADRHARNALVDKKSKTIHIIDLGQAERFRRSRVPWRSDDRYIVAQFLRALKENDAARVARFGAQMGIADTELAADKHAALTAAVATVLTTAATPSDQFIALFKAFSQYDVLLEDRFAFGVLKGLMTIAGEKYVLADDFDAIVHAEVSRLLGRKIVQTTLDEVHDRGLRHTCGLALKVASGN